jgi:hypothetical protein
MPLNQSYEGIALSSRLSFLVPLLVFLSGCGPFYYKYAAPPAGETDVKVVIRYSGDAVYPQAGYFLNGANCSDLRDLEISPLGSKEVVTRAGEPATFTLSDLSVKGQYIRSCGFGTTFYPERGKSYRLDYIREGTVCRLALTQIGVDGKVERDVTSLLQERKPQSQFFNSPEKSFCSDQMPTRR